jgi:hypothetical protein
VLRLSARGCDEGCASVTSTRYVARRRRASYHIRYACRVYALELQIRLPTLSTRRRKHYITPARQSRRKAPECHPGYRTPVTQLSSQIHPRSPSSRAPPRHIKTPLTASPPLALRTARPRTHGKPAGPLPHPGRKHQVRLQRLLARRKGLVAVHPQLEVLVRAGVFEGGVPLARRALLEHDGEATAAEAGYAGDLLEAGGFQGGEGVFVGGGGGGGEGGVDALGR